MASGGFIHDFDGTIAEVFGLTLYWYGAAYTFGFLGVFGWFTLQRRALDWPMATVLDLCIFAAAGALLGGRAFDILVYESAFYAEHPVRALDWWQGGMASHGVLLGGFLGVLAFCRLYAQPLLKVTDELAVPVALLLAIGRVGNFIEGGVVGIATDLPWGVHYRDLEGARHPVALYESAKNLVMVPILILALRRHRPGSGIATALFVLLYAGLRFAVDLLRDYEATFLGLDTGQYFNLFMAAFGLGLLLRFLRPGRRPDAAVYDVAADAARPVGLLRPVLFALLCLYPLGIPTSWTRDNIEHIRNGGVSLSAPRPAAAPTGGITFDFAVVPRI